MSFQTVLLLCRRILTAKRITTPLTEITKSLVYSRTIPPLCITATNLKFDRIAGSQDQNFCGYQRKRGAGTDLDRAERHGVVEVSAPPVHLAVESLEPDALIREGFTQGRAQPAEYFDSGAESPFSIGCTLRRSQWMKRTASKYVVGYSLKTQPVAYDDVTR